MFLKFLINFSIYTKAGANFKKLETVGLRCFNTDFYFFLKFLCILEKKLAEIKKPRRINRLRGDF